MSEWSLLSILLVFMVIFSVLVIYPLRKNKTVTILLLPLIFILTALGYSNWGGFLLWQEAMHQAHARKIAEQMLRSIHSPQDLIDQLRAKLDDTPASAKGWYLLGRLYISQDDKKHADEAFGKAQSLGYSMSSE
ncbi:MAG: hypothetical protein WC627_07640 [Legionella sp.]|jgi:cytochrome c-type biogenesis protein CcmH/NrfG